MSTAPSPLPAAAPVVDRRTAARASRAAIIGTTIEYYDFTLFGLAAATVFPTVFFAGASPFVATLSSIATFSVAFLVRPFSGALLGSLGDRIGRRRVLVLSMTLMGIATVVIGLIPAASTIGGAAPLALLAMRVLQGVGASAEYSGATLVAMEFAAPHRRGLLGALPAAGNGIGGMVGTLAMLVASTTLSAEQFHAWGWRVPFLFGGVILVYGLWLRVRLPETPEFEPARRAGETSRTPLRDTLRTGLRAILAVMLIVLARTGLAYFFLVFLVSFAARQVGLSATTVLVANLVSTVVYVVLTPSFGALSDRAGRIPVILGGLGLVAVTAFPLFALVRPGWPFGLVLAMIIGNGVAVAAMVAPVGRLITELFPATHRYSAMGLANETGIAVGGAVVPPLAVYLAYLPGAGTTALSLLLIAVAALGVAGLALLPRRAPVAPVAPGVVGSEDAS
ncbi:MFS transporter [Pseudonocardia sp. GCM10023141]|uniref:MFS transporter n=1 Tax=Pseudonocardia sp. GCM10023141 TaxID=3252653 RepID=UPI003623A764